MSNAILSHSAQPKSQAVPGTGLLVAAFLAVWSFLIRFVTPVALILIFLHQVRLF